VKLIRVSSAIAVVLLLLVGAFAGPAFAQQNVDSDGYPLDIDDNIIDDDVTVDDPEVQDAVVVADETKVLGRTLPLTGGQLTALVLAGLLLLSFGGIGLAATRRRRQVQGPT
jgi:LPXTG-motif cell wall-anchored protein